MPRPLIAGMVLQFAASGAVLPFITLLLRDRGLSFDRISTILLAGSAIMLVAPFFWGMLADRYVALDRLFVIINVLGAAALAGLAAQTTFAGLLIAFTLYTACLTPTFSLINALSFHHLPHPREQFGRLRSCGSLGWVLPFLPIACWTAWRPEAGLNFTLHLGMGLCLVMAILAFWLPPTPPLARCRRAADSGTIPMGGIYVPAVKRLLSDVNYLVVLAAMLLVAGSFAVLTYYSPPFLEDLGVPRPWIGPIQALGVICEIILFQVQPALIRRWNYATVILIGCGALLLRQLMFAQLNDPWLLSASYVLAGMVIVFFHMGISVLVNALAAAEVRATAQTLLAFCGLGLGPMLANWTAGRLALKFDNNLRPVFLFAAGMAALAALLIGLRGKQLNQAGLVER